MSMMADDVDGLARLAPGMVVLSGPFPVPLPRPPEVHEEI
jgi:hypothetical protein